MIGTRNTHGHQFAGFLNGWRQDVVIPSRWMHGSLPQFYTWAKRLRELEESGFVPVDDARVTRIWSENPETEGALIAEACGAELVASPAEATERVDAVLLLTDDPLGRADLAAPALRARLPVFVDKPLAPSVEAAHDFASIANEKGVPWFSGSAFHFCPSLFALKHRIPLEIGSMKGLYVQVPGWIEHYGIHALEIVNVLAGHDVVDLRGVSVPGRSSALLSFSDGNTAMVENMTGAFDPPGQAIVWGENGSLHWEAHDAPDSLFAMVQAFVQMVRTGTPPFPAEESLKMACLALRLTAATT